MQVDEGTGHSSPFGALNQTAERHKLTSPIIMKHSNVNITLGGRQRKGALLLLIPA